MRYYDLTLTDPQTGLVWQTTNNSSLGFVKLAGGTTFTSYVNGKTLPGALNIEFDIPVYPFAQPQGNSWIRVWGVGLTMLGQASQMAFQNLTLRGGMQKGLPLANPAQKGLLVQGQVYQAFGNWQGVDQTLDMVVYPSAAASGQDIMFSCAKGTDFVAAVVTALQGAFGTKGYKVVSKVTAILLSPQIQPGHYTTLAEFAAMVQEVSQQLGAAVFGTTANPYPGVDITISGTTIYLTDTTGIEPATQLEFQDLIGQPTWIDALTVNFKTVMRADISVGSYVKFPLGVQTPYALTTLNAIGPNVPANNRLIFQGTFRVTEVHHFANFRQAEADSWVTTFSAVAMGTGA